MNEVLAPKQREVMERVISKDFFICGLHGAKRSGKTYINNLVFMYEITRVRKIADELGVDEPMYILAGTSSTAIQNNVLQELYNSFGIEPKYDKHGSFILGGVKVIQVYTGSIAGLKRARGFTAYGAYVNEASLATEDVFKEVISRCSGDGARILWDSNPDNPNHWLKTDYVGNEDDTILDFSFALDDNIFLSDRYRKSIKSATPSGKFYDRDILGLWTVAEGAIYTDFDKDIHIIDEAKHDIVEYYAGVDWGYDHYGSIVILGEDELGNTYIVDGAAERGEEIDWWVDQAKYFKELYGDMMFYADSARPEYVVRFRKEGMRAVNGNKSVIPGIEEVAKRFKNKSLFYVKDSLPKFEDEIYNYRWKPNSTEDKPIKEHDDVLDALRYAIYSKSMSNNKVRTISKSALGL